MALKLPARAAFQSARGWRWHDSHDRSCPCRRSATVVCAALDSFAPAPNRRADGREPFRPPFAARWRTAMTAAGFLPAQTRLSMAITSNLVSLCRHHHRFVHEGGASIESLESGEIRFCRNDGTSIVRVLELPPATPLPTECCSPSAAIPTDDLRPIDWCLVVGAITG